MLGFSNSSLWTTVGVVSIVGGWVVGPACGGTDPVLDERQGGAGATVSDQGGSAGSEPEVDPECVDAPDELRLEFQKLEVEGAGDATDFAFFPSSKEFLLTTNTGSLIHGELKEAAIEVQNSWTFAEEVVADLACGPSNVLFDPDFETNRFVYVSYCWGDMSVTQLVRYVFDETDGLTDRTVIFETSDGAMSPWHRIGSMGFEPDGETLWMYSGDQGKSEHGQDPSGPEGAVLRIVPNRDPEGSGHSYPEGNMVDDWMGGMGGAGNVEPHPAVYAYGVRSPWRGTLDASGRFWVGDVADQGAEEVNLVTEAGHNFGWPLYEGPCESDCSGLTDPIIWYAREDDHPYVSEDPDTVASTQRAIWVGQIYQDVQDDRYCNLMDDMVVYGDLFTGWVRGARADADGQVTFDESLGNLPLVTQWRVGPDGYAYALLLNGSIHRAVMAEN